MARIFIATVGRFREDRLRDHSATWGDSTVATPASMPMPPANSCGTTRRIRR
ncbi:MAG: hypothetical protein IPF98_01230 [Gemmatimonadetes bacterium]|nr:hypothetical protein [Gemmatimonadota bacterium]